MTHHPFIARVRAERTLISAVNRLPGLAATPLAGLSRAAVLQWAEHGINHQFAQPARQQIIDTLLTISSRLRLGSTASHRGVLLTPPPDDKEIEGEIEKLRIVLAQQSSLSSEDNPLHPV